MNTIENKCALLAQTPQSRWFDLRFKAFVSMVNGLDTPCIDIASIFPIAPMIKMVGYCFKYEGKYYFLIAFKEGIVYECFNVETLSFHKDYSNIVSSNIILSSDDDSDRLHFLPILMSRSNIEYGTLKTKIETIFATAVHRDGARKL
jgi:hypothetical protein